MKSVEKNTFYRGTDITKAIAIKPNYSDMAWGGTDTAIILRGGTDPTYYALSGTVAATPKYGQSKLMGGYMQVYCEGVTMPNIPVIPQLELYVTKQGTEIEEGTMRLSYPSGTVAANNETGADISVYRSGVDSDNYYMIEEFDAADKTVGDVKMIRSLGNGTAELAQAYLTVQDALDTAKSLGGVLGYKREECLKNFFAEKVEGAGKFAFGDRVFITPETGDMNGVWRPQEDRRSGNEKAAWKKPYWKWKDIKAKLKFAQKVGVGSDIESSVLASKGNTIFDDVYASSSINNPFTSSETNPLMMTACELSTAKKYSGGQAFRMYHLWDYSTNSQQIQKAMGARGIIPSMTRASIYNLPQPNMGLDATMLSGSGLGWRAAAVPTIDMRMNVSKLGFTPYLNLGGATGYSDGKAYYDDPPPGSGWTGTDVDNATYQSDTYVSLLRSVVVTFSNYKPKADHTTLDKFLDYGLQRFYNGDTTEHVVGGVAILKAGIDSASVGTDPSTIYAATLPVGPYLDAANNTTTQDYGLVQLTTNSAGLQDTLQVGTTGWISPTTTPVREVQLPMDSWFNMKFVMDAWAPNTVNSARNDLYTESTTGLESSGVPMRCYFETEIAESGTTDSSGLLNNPYLDVYFPAVSGSGQGYHKYYFSQPANYPKHMTVWVQNYRWISGSSTMDYNNSFGIFEYGDDNGGYPSGAAIEAEVFIDNIKLSNFTPDIENCSAGASIRNQQFFTFKDEGIVTPFQTITKGTSPNVYNVRGWAVSGANTSGNLVEQDMQESMIFGFEDTYQLPNSTGNNWTTNANGYIMANGFSTANFNSLDKVPLTGVMPNGCAWVSVSGTNQNQKYLGGQFFGIHYYKTSTEISANYDNTSVSGSVINITGDGTTNNLTSPATGNVNLMTGTTSSIPSQDGFTTKGLFRYEMSGSGFDADNTWTRREHIMTSTKIKQVPGMTAKDGTVLNSNQIKVANPQVFNKHLDESYIIYIMGEAVPSAATGSANTLGWGKKGVGSVTELKLSTDTSIVAGPSVITFDQDIIESDVSGTDICIEDNITRLWVGPKKYWLNLTWYANQTQRTYQNFCIVQNVEAGGSSNAVPTAAAITGSTWNESLYSYDSAQRATTGMSGLYLRNWDLNVDEESTLELGKDYGYGAFDEETRSGGQVATSNAKISNYVYLDLMKLARDTDTTQGNPLVFRLGIQDSTGNQSITLTSDESTQYARRPRIYWQFKDELPKITQPLSVQPNYNILSGSGSDKVDLYKLDREELNALKFTWEEEGDDVLYRLLYVDTRPIEDKYHGILFHAPLNELPAADGSTTFKYYISGTSTGVSFADTPKSVITGAAGYAFGNVAGAASTGGGEQKLRTATSWSSPWWNKGEATFIAHVTPDLPTGGGSYDSYIFSDKYSTKGSVALSITRGSTAGGDVTPKFVLSSGATIASDSVTVTSAYSFKQDAENPLFIVITFDNTLPTDCIKMYVNGMLVKTSGTDWGQGDTIWNGSGYSASGRFNIGQYDEASTSGAYFGGTIEEVIVHDKCLYVPTEANQYILPTTYLPDMDGTTYLEYNAKLFLFDYHNIIGAANDEVCSSNNVSWRATGI